MAPLGYSSFMNLPDEIKLYIFSFFNQHELFFILAKVCLDWQELTQDSTFWKRCRIQPHQWFNYQKVLATIPSIGQLTIDIGQRVFRLPKMMVCQQKLKVLKITGDMSGMFKMSVREGRFLSQQFPVLEKIKINITDSPVNQDQNDLTPAAWMCVFELPHLRKVACTNRRIRRHDLNGYATLICTIIRTVKTLTYLKLDIMNAHILQCLVRYHRSSLRELIVKDETCSYIQTEDLVYLTQLTGLEKISLRRFWVGIYHPVDQHFFKAFGHLSTLHLTQYIMVHDVELATLSTLCPLIHTLILENDTLITDKGLTKVISQCRLLTCLKIDSNQVNIQSSQAIVHIYISETISATPFRSLLRKFQATITSLKIHWQNVTFPYTPDPPFIIDQTIHFKNLTSFSLTSPEILSPEECRQCLFSIPFVTEMTITSYRLLRCDPFFIEAPCHQIEPRDWFNPFLCVSGLTQLTVHAETLDNVQLYQIIKYGHRLERIHLKTRMPLYTKAAMLNVCRSRKNTLKAITLNMAICDQSVLDELGPHIQELVLYHDYMSMNGYTIRMTREINPSVFTLPKSLLHLTLDSVNLNDISLNFISCPLLSSFTIKSCRQISHHGIKSILYNCPHLRKLKVQHMNLPKRFIRSIPLSIQFDHL